jgi:alpha-aminoadipate carrier protein LysW
MSEIECLDCGEKKELGASTEQGEIITCSCCGTLLEVLSLSPIKIGKAPQIEEDYGE